jgi:cytosine/adenosine deaminase-related metal-dependent hydrolase
VLLPALVNAHTHLELSYLRGASARRVVHRLGEAAAGRARAPPDPDDVTEAPRAAITEASNRHRLFGDVSNALGAVPALRWSRRRRACSTSCSVQRGRAGARVAERGPIDAERASARRGLPLQPGAARAVFGVAGALRRIRHDATGHGDPTTVHLAESREEVQLLADGSGPWRALLETLGVWTDAWQPPGLSPVAYLQQRGFIDASTLVVHGVQCTADDVARLRDSGATLVSCPRSNAYVGAGQPPLPRSTAPACRWRSAPTAWRASRI